MTILRSRLLWYITNCIQLQFPNIYRTPIKKTRWPKLSAKLFLRCHNCCLSVFQLRNFIYASLTSLGSFQKNFRIFFLFSELPKTFFFRKFRVFALKSTSTVCDKSEKHENLFVILIQLVVFLRFTRFAVSLKNCKYVGNNENSFLFSTLLTYHLHYKCARVFLDVKMDGASVFTSKFVQMSNRKNLNKAEIYQLFCESGDLFALCGKFYLRCCKVFEYKRYWVWDIVLHF